MPCASGKGKEEEEEEGKESLVEDWVGSLVPRSYKTPFIQALFTNALLVFIGMCLAGLWAVYLLLFAFLKPMMWAVLVGTVLFPFKRRVTEVIRGWLRGLRGSGTPLAVGVCLLPLRWLDSTAEAVWAILTSHSIFFVIGGYVTLKFLTHEGAFVSLIGILARLYQVLSSIIVIFSGTWVIPIGLVYTGGFLAWAKVHVSAAGGEEGWNKRLAHFLCSPIWFWALCLGASFFGFLRVPVWRLGPGWTGRSTQILSSEEESTVERESQTGRVRLGRSEESGDKKSQRLETSEERRTDTTAQ